MRKVPGPSLRAVMVVFLLTAPPRAAQARDRDLDLEAEVKVEFIQRFTNYIEWPADAFESKTSPFNVCTLGEGALRPRIESVLGKGKIQDRPVRVRSLKGPAEASGCHILYIAPSERDQVDRIVHQIGRSPVLTIGDTGGYWKHGVLINLFLEGAHVRFMINAAAAKLNGLAVSVKLLVLARPGD